MRLQVVLAMLILYSRYEIDLDHFGKFTDFWSDAAYIQGQVQKCTDINTGEFFSSSHDIDLLEKFSKLASRVKDQQ